MIASPFVIDVAQDDLDDLRDRLERSRIGIPLGSRWSAGTDPAYLEELVTYWHSDFDWRAREAELNAVPHHVVELDGRRLHFVHLRARGPQAKPPTALILTHGWPSSFIEMLPLADRLADPVSDGDVDAIAFDVVIPSLPGFGFSQLPASGPVVPSAIADLWVRLMTDVLGYERFGAYGGDVGSHVTNFLGACHADRVLGIHTHHPNLHPVLHEDAPLLTAERDYLAARTREHDDSDDGYAVIQSTRPDTLAAGLTDSPAGLAAWIVEKYRAWGDCGGDIEARFSKDTLLSIITLYWVTETIGTSFRAYLDDAQTPPLPPVTAPAGIRLTPEDHNYPRAFAERTYTDLRQWRGARRGGHFLALEEPDMLADDLRDFFGGLR